MSNVFDMLDNVRELHKEIYVEEKVKRDLKSYIANNIVNFYKELDTAQFVEVINIYKDCFKDRESNIIDILKSKNIPYILANIKYDSVISEKYIENLAYESYNNDELVEALEYIKLLHHKYEIGLNIHILRGDILKELGGINSAIDSYKDAKNLKSLDFTANTRIVTTYIKKYKKELYITCTLLVAIIVGQFILFDTGVISSKLYDFEINMNEGEYIVEEEDTIIVPLDSIVNVNIDYKIMPFYGYEGQVSYKIEDENIALIDRHNNIKSISEGSTDLLVTRDEKVVHSYKIVVIKPKVDSIELSMDDELYEVGDIGKLNVRLIKNYDFEMDTEIRYKSSDRNIIKVDDEGMVEVVGAGKASVIVTCGDITKEEEFLINLVVEELNVDYDVDIEVGEEHILKVEVVTNSDNKHKPRAMFSLEENSDVEPVISMDSSGKIKGLREGTQIVNVNCGNLQKDVIVTVTPKDITKLEVSNLKATHEIVDEYLNVHLTWNSLELDGRYEYDIYARFKGEDEFRKVGTTSGEDTSYDIEYDLSKFEGNNRIDMYVVGVNQQGESNRGNTVSIRFSHTNPDEGLTDKETTDEGSNSEESIIQ